VEPTQAGVLAVTNHILFSNVNASISFPGSSAKTITQPTLGVVTAVPISDQTYNPQTGLMEQTIELTNISTNGVSSARVVVSGLGHRLYNAVGTNHNSPFVVYSGALAPTGKVELILEYFIPSRTPVDNPTLTAYPITPLDLRVTNGSPANITRSMLLAPGRLLIEFPSTPGQSYRILYGDAMNSITNAAQPTIVAPADRVQWIDDGPPKTISRLTNGMMRFYRAIETP